MQIPICGSSVAQADRNVSPGERKWRAPDGTRAIPSPASTNVNTPDHVEELLTILGEKPG